MKYRNLGRTGVQVSPLALGCMMFGGKTDLSESCRIIDRALDAGINVLDTANVYHRGRSEEVTGEALKRNGKREKVVLCTKVHGVMDSDDPNMRGTSRRHIVQQCEASLRRLGTDYIDLYQLHRPCPEIAIDETLRAMDDLVRSGKVRYVGASTFAAWQVVEALWCSKELALNRITCEQPPYSLLDRRIETELLPMAATYGLGILAWSPLAGGILTGKYRLGQAIPEGTRFASMASNPIAASRWTQLSLEIVEQLMPLAEAKATSLGRYALAWVLCRPGISSAIVGPRTLEQLEDNLKALDIQFDEEELRRVDSIVPPGTATSPYYDVTARPSEYRW